MKFSKDWSEEQDTSLKGFHECNWEESCTMCHTFKECEDEFNTEKDKFEGIELDKLDSLN